MQKKLRWAYMIVGFLALCGCFSSINTTATEWIVKTSLSKNAVVVAAHPLATQVGIDILKKGGNAVDAAVAVQLALAVVYPRAGNLGGGGFMVYKQPHGQVVTLDYRERAPQAAHKDMYLDANEKPIAHLSTRKHLSVGVPGTPAGLYAAWRKHGRLKNWADLVQPAILLAEKGFCITTSEAKRLNDNRVEFDTCNTIKPIFVKSSPWQTNERLVQRDLAETLKRMAKQGDKGFYQGKTADLIVAEMQRGGGLITRQDLSIYKAIWRQPLTGTYRGYRIYTMPPPSSGGVLLLQMLKMIEPYPVAETGFQSAATAHLMVEVERRAFAERANNLGDPDFWQVPLKTLLDSNHIAGLMEQFDPLRASRSVDIPTPTYSESEQTTHLSIVDPWGGAVAVTTTLNDNYGSFVVVGGAGFLLNDEMDDFTIKPGSPNMYGSITGLNNAIMPGKTMLSSMTPTIVTKNDTLFLVVGTPGGTTIPTSVFQVIVNCIDFGMNAGQAVAAHRFHHQAFPDSISAEPLALAPAVRQELKNMGHSFKPRGAIGLIEAVRRRTDGWYEGAADPRSDDAAGGF